MKIKIQFACIVSLVYQLSSTYQQLSLKTLPQTLFSYRKQQVLCEQGHHSNRYSLIVIMTRKQSSSSNYKFTCNTTKLFSLLIIVTYLLIMFYFIFSFKQDNTSLQWDIITISLLSTSSISSSLEQPMTKIINSFLNKTKESNITSFCSLK